MFLRGLEGWHVVIIVGLLAVLFGSRKMPDAARSIGQSLRIFKSEVKAAREDESPGQETTPPAPPAHPARPAPQPIEAAPTGAHSAAHHTRQQNEQREHTTV